MSRRKRAAKMPIARRAFQRAINDFCFYRIAVIFCPFPRKSRVSLRIIIARRAFLSLTFIQATLHACIPACDFTFPKFNRITVYFYKFRLSRRTFPRMKNARRAIFVRGLFVVSWIYSRFVRGWSNLFALLVLYKSSIYRPLSSGMLTPQQRTY